MTGKDKYLLGGSKEDRTRLFSVVPSERARCKGHKLKYRKYPLNVTESFFFFFSCEDGQTLKQVAQRLCEVFILKDIQDSTGNSSKQL